MKAFLVLAFTFLIIMSTVNAEDNADFEIDKVQSLLEDRTLPSSLSFVSGNQRVNIYILSKLENRQVVLSVVTEKNKVVSISKEELKDPTLIINTDDDTVKSILESSDRMKGFQSALKSEKVVVKGKTFSNKIKLVLFSFVLKFKDFSSGDVKSNIVTPIVQSNNSVQVTHKTILSVPSVTVKNGPVCGLDVNIPVSINSGHNIRHLQFDVVFNHQQLKLSSQIHSPVGVSLGALTDSNLAVLNRVDPIPGRTRVVLNKDRNLTLVHDGESGDVVVLNFERLGYGNLSFSLINIFASGLNGTDINTIMQDSSDNGNSIVGNIYVEDVENCF